MPKKKYLKKGQGIQPGQSKKKATRNPNLLSVQTLPAADKRLLKGLSLAGPAASSLKSPSATKTQLI